MNQKQTPLACLFGFQNGRCMTFIGRDGYIDAEGPVKAIKKILSHCNGYNTVERIKKLCKGVPSQLIDEILDGLSSLGVVCDSRQLYLQFHIDSALLWLRFGAVWTPAARNVRVKMVQKVPRFPALLRLMAKIRNRKEG